ncbi:MAG TPA: PIG-L deacetylase family protein [Acidimicrobiales bacterium]|nr:PIG-L deacetylase family protein [Acidimicrobiales bacterium]
MPELLDEVPASAVAIYAHPDDPEVSCGGTLARWAAAGAEVHVVVCTSGDKGSSDPETDPAALAARRAGEVARGTAALGVAGHHLLGHPDGEIEDDAVLRGELVGVIRRLRPEVVVCPDPTAVFFGQHYVNHRDHRVVGWAAVDATAHSAGLPHYFPDAGPPHRARAAYLSGTLDPDIWVDIAATVEAKSDALLCHESQLGETGEWLRTVVRERAEEAGRAVGVRYAESFRRLRF